MMLKDAHYRPQYHFTPPANWLNDPNGLVFFQGEYHMFYQYFPGGSHFGLMHWGHAVSTDLVNWRHLPVALHPDEHGSIFSGGVVIDWEDTAGFGREAMVAVFTHDKQNYQSQSLAYSIDGGRSWAKYAHNPVIRPPENQPDFRDPKVFWYGEKGAGHWVMALAVGETIHFYTSPDLIHWNPASAFGQDHGSHPGTWETPDLFELPVEGSAASRWVLTTGVGDGGPAGRSGMQYFIGHFDGERFTPDDPKHTVLWLDHGADYYAAQSWNEEPAGRRLMVGWMSNWQYARAVPTSSWRGSISLVRELCLRQTPKGIRLFQQPIREYAALRRTQSQWTDATITPGRNLLEAFEGSLFEIIAEFELNAEVDSFGFGVRTGVGEQTIIGYEARREKLYLDRSQSGDSSFDPHFAGLHSADLPPAAGAVRMHIFIDRSSVEVFGNDGQVVISDCIFPGAGSLGLKLFTQGGDVLLKRLDLIELMPASITATEKDSLQEKLP